MMLNLKIPGEGSNTGHQKSSQNLVIDYLKTLITLKIRYFCSAITVVPTACVKDLYRTASERLVPFTLLAIIASASACVTTQGYAGPPRAESEVSNIDIRSTGDIQLSDLEIDKRLLGAFSSSADVLPGEHKLNLRYNMKEERCDSSSYCYVSHSSGTCDGSVRTLAGRKYLVTVERKYSSVAVRISPKAYFDFSNRDDEPSPGFATCRETY